MKKYAIFADNLYVPIYATVLNVICSNGVYEGLYEQGHLENKTKAWCAKTQALFHINEKTNNWILCFDWNKLTHEIVAHECLHATFAILESKGIKYDANHKDASFEEVYCYLLGWLVGEVTNMLKDYIK